jgi:signal transduction histidine kinase
MYPIIPLAITYVVIHDHQSAWNFLPLMIGGTMAAGGQWVIVVAGCEVMARPMVEEVAAYLPDDFEPPAVGTSLRIRALAPLPVVTMFAAVITGAYASDVFKSGTSRLMFATAVALATTAVATAIFVLLNRSVLSPIDDLIAATRRVRHGDITTPVPLTSADELGGLAFSFNEMLADLRRHTEALRASRERIVAAADDERRRIERDLHDGAQQHLVLVGLKLRMAQRLVCTDAGAAAALLDEVHDDVERALAELRDLAHGIYPVSLQSDGLRGALREVVRRSPLPAQLDCDGAGRYRPELEAAVYFCCLEALQNAAKHAGPEARATVRLSQTGGAVRFEVSDDGRGFDPAAVTNHRSGLQNMTDRIGALGGELEIASTPTTGTTVTGTVPLESA